MPRAITTFSGALQPKKKSELQELASALHLSDQGTKDELQARIKKHLDLNQQSLEENPVFAGLFGRRRRSVQPQPAAPTSRFAPELEVKSTPAKSSHATSLNPIVESTPVADLHDVSLFLKRPVSPNDSSPIRPLDRVEHKSPVTPSNLPLPPSPPGSTVEHASMTKLPPLSIEPREGAVMPDGNEMFMACRKFLSNSRNIWSLTAVCEVVYLLCVIIPWRSVKVALAPSSNGGLSINLYYPPLDTFWTSAFWAVIVHWAIPTLVIPAVVGNLISFNPISRQACPAPSQPLAPFDPLTASIVRLAAQISYPYAKFDVALPMHNLDVLGFQLRVLTAGIGLAFAFSEQIAQAPGLFADSLMRQRDIPPTPPLRRSLEPEAIVIDNGL